MLARVTLLLLLAGTCGYAATVEPKPRPRLAPAVVAPEKREAGRDAADPVEFRSFDDYLQAQARRPVGLEALPAVAAARSEAAAEKQAAAAKDSPLSPARTETGVGADVLILPKMEVTAEKLTKLKQQLAALKANQSWETSSAEAWGTRSEAGLVMDAILNPPFLRLGSYSGTGRIALARQRVEMLRWVKILTISLEEAKTPAEKARIQADIDAITDITRMWE